MEKKKIGWLSLLQGFSMLLVVAGHVSLTNEPGDPATPVATGIERVIYTFHMPLFMFISGWLFYHTCLRRGRTYGEVLRSKLKRLGAPFLTFTLAATALKAAFPSLMHRQVTAAELVDTFVLFRSNPLGEMWFVVTLFELMLLYPLYRRAMGSPSGAAAAICAGVAAYYLPPPTSLFSLPHVARMAPFFVAGIACSRWQWQRRLSGRVPLGVTSALFACCNVAGVLPDAGGFLSACTGIAFSFSLCLNLYRRRPGLFGSFRDYTFQIFLMGIFFQMAIRWTYVRMGIGQLFAPLWLASVLTGIYAPVVIARAVQKHAPERVRLCFGL